MNQEYCDTVEGKKCIGVHQIVICIDQLQQCNLTSNFATFTFAFVNNINRMLLGSL